jgi:hypothetical protein
MNPPSALVPGARVRLPSGNVVILLQVDGDEWQCVYDARARARGDVVFRSAFLAGCVGVPSPEAKP